MTNLLSRVYNSTLGVPQQILYRTLRALKDEDIDLLSREGLLAPELMPLVGVMASHETDATVEEIFGDNGGVTNFLLDMATDPATYLTAGLTGIAKAGKSVRSAQVGAGLKGQKLIDQGVDVSKFKTAGELREALHAGLQNGQLKGKAVKRAARDLGQVGKNTRVEDLIQSSAKDELLITIPGLARWGAAVRPPAPIRKHKSWFAFQNHLFYKKPLEAAQPALRWMGKGLRESGEIGEALMDGLNHVADLGRAYRLGYSSLESTFAANVADFGNDQMAAAKFDVRFGSAARKLQRTDIQQVVARVRKKIEAGKPLEDIVKTRGIPKELREEILKWPTSKTKPVATENIAEPLGEFLNEIRVGGKRANRVLEEAKTTFDRKELPELGSKHWSAEVAYNTGQRLRKARELMFHRGNPDTSEWITKLQDEHLKREAEGRLILQGKQRQLIEAVERIAKEEGISPEEVSKVLNIHTEGTLHPLDLAANMAALKQGSPREMESAARNFTDILGRMRGTIEALKGVTKVDKRTMRMLDALDSASLDVLFDEGVGVSRLEITRISAEQLGARMAPRFAGKRLFELSDGELDELRHTEAVLDPELRQKIRKVRKTRPQEGPDALRHYRTEQIVQSKRIQELSEDDLLAAIKQTDDKKLRSRLRDTLRRKRQGLPPKAPFIDTEVPFVLGDPTPEIQAMTDYMKALLDIKEGRFTTITLEHLERGHQQLGRLVPEQARHVFKKANQEDIDLVFGLSDDAARLAHQANGFSMGAPLGYLPRLRNRAQDRKLRKLLGQVDGVPGLKGVASNFKKRIESGRSLTLEEIGTKLDEVEEASLEGKKLAGEVRELMEAEGLTPGRYISDHVDLMMSRMGRDFDQYNATKLINDTFGEFAEHANKSGMVGGKVVGVLDAKHQDITHSTKRSKLKGTDKGLRFSTKKDKTRQAARFLVVEQPDGRRALVDLHEAVRDKLSIELMPGDADTLGHAFVGHQLSGARLNPLEDVEIGQWVMAGGDDMLQMYRSQIAPEPGKFADAWAAFDAVNFTLKKFQTVLRPAHQIGNLLSGIFQSQAAGASVGSIALAHHDVAKILFGLGDATDINKDLVKAAGFKGDFKAGRDTALMVDGLLSGKSLENLDELGGVKMPHGEVSHLEIWQGAQESGLLQGTFSRQDIKIGGRESTESVVKKGNLQRLRYADDKTWQEGVSAFWEQALQYTQLPEITARMSTVYALYYDGHRLEDAYELARRAHVDYSELGVGERAILKRAIPYYTFGRKYIPWALERMARDPKLANTWVTALEQNGNMGIDANGKAVYEKGKFQLDMGRTNANIDALMAVMGTAEHLLPGTIAQVNGVQQVEAPPFMSVGGGGLAGVLLGSIGETGFEADSAAKALMDATFVGRLFKTAASGDLAEMDNFVTGMMLPARFNNEPERAAQFQVNMAKRQLRRLELMAQEAKSPAEVQDLREQALRIREAVLTVQKDFGR